MPDLNKSPLTHDITRVAALWLEERGFKPVETEVCVWMDRVALPGDGEPCWLADLAGIINPTQTEMIDLKLLRRRPRWGSPENDAWELERNALYRNMIALVEVKASRADFRGDRKWKMQIPTDLAYLAIPRGIVQPHEWPAGWGILEYNDGALRCLRPPAVFQISIEERFRQLHAIAVRRDHHTRNARWREMVREHHAEDVERLRISRLRNVASAVLAIANGERDSLEQCLRWHGLRDCPDWLVERLKPLWRIAKP